MGRTQVEPAKDASNPGRVELKTDSTGGRGWRMRSAAEGAVERV